MKNNVLLKGALAFAAASIIGASAHAQTLLANPSDVIFNMYATGGPGTSYDYEVDLGSYSNFLSGGSYDTGAVVTLSGVSIADISGSVSGQGFGSNWDSDGDVNWSVIGTNYTNTVTHAPKYTVLATDTGALANFMNQTTAQTTSANIALYPNQINTDGLSTTANSSSAIFDNQGDLSEYYDAAGGTGSAPFFGGLPTSFEVTASGATTTGLYEALPSVHTGNATELGTFTLSSSGLTYQAVAAVPEPSTWATILVGAATLFGLRRRRMA
jgi:hypothetical protein